MTLPWGQCYTSVNISQGLVAAKMCLKGKGMNNMRLLRTQKGTDCNIHDLFVHIEVSVM